MLELSDLIAKATTITPTVLLAALVLDGGLLLTVGSWRTAMLALLLQYIIVAVLMLGALAPQLALVQALVGSLVCVILYLAERRATQLRQRPAEGMWGGRAFRFLATMAGLLAAWTFAERWALPAGGFGQNLALYWLAAVAMLCGTLGRSPLRIGMGLMGFLTGVGLLYLFLERSLALVAAYAIVQLVTALVIAYLEVAAASPPTFAERGGA